MKVGFVQKTHDYIGLGSFCVSPASFLILASQMEQIELLFMGEPGKISSSREYSSRTVTSKARPQIMQCLCIVLDKFSSSPLDLEDAGISVLFCEYYNDS